jgi:hypothetical protein
MREVKIYKHIGGTMGVYDIYNDRISLHVDLDKFPKLKKQILEHEMNHRNDKNMLSVLWRELKDYARIYATDEYWKYSEYQNRKRKKVWWVIVIDVVQNLVYLIAIHIINAIGMIYGAICYVLRKLINQLQKLKNDT